MNKTKKILIGLLPALAIAGVVYAAPYSLQELFIKLGLIQEQVEVLQAQVDAPMLKGFQTQTYCFNNTTATSSTSHIGYWNIVDNVRQATTTFAACNIERADKVTLNLNMTGSSTSATLALLFEFSENGSDWFTKSNSTVAGGAFTHVGSTTELIAGTVGTTTVSIPVITPSDGLQHKFIRVSANAVGKNGTTSIWSSFVKREFNN